MQTVYTLQTHVIKKDLAARRWDRVGFCGASRRLFLAIYAHRRSYTVNPRDRLFLFSQILKNFPWISGGRVLSGLLGYTAPETSQDWRFGHNQGKLKVRSPQKIPSKLKPKLTVELGYGASPELLRLRPVLPFSVGAAGGEGTPVPHRGSCRLPWMSPPLQRGAAGSNSATTTPSRPWRDQPLGLPGAQNPGSEPPSGTTATLVSFTLGWWLLPAGKITMMLQYHFFPL